MSYRQSPSVLVGDSPYYSQAAKTAIEKYDRPDNGTCLVFGSTLMGFEFESCSIPGLLLVKPHVHSDARGFFCEVFKKSEFWPRDMDADFVQDNYSRSWRNVLRGLHYQLSPAAQGKLIHVVFGKIWDVAVDLRRSSPSFGKWYALELSDENNFMLWVPPGFAHGFITLSAEARTVYKCTSEYDPSKERGIRWDDPIINVDWPIRDVLVSPRDIGLPYLRDADLFD